MPVTLAYDDLRRVLEGERLPAAVVDLDAFDENLARLAGVARAHGLTLRLATKSVRVPALLERAARRGGAAVKGLMSFSVEEAVKLAALGEGDVLVAYPTLQPAALRAFCALARAGKDARLAVDSDEGVRALGAAAGAEGATVGAVVCADMSLELFGGRVHAGVRRSPLRTPDDVVRVARRVAETPHLRFRGLLAYEAQIAGVGDDRAHLRAMRAASLREIRARRPAIVRALRAAGLAPELVNGGGTGSVDETTRETGVTEIAVGSGLYKPHLFDRYSSAGVAGLAPALFFALEAVRRPSPRHVTCAGGGYVASGAAGRDRHPVPWRPEGLRLLPMEMAGEVQTPLEGEAAARVELGAPVIFRPAKAGEPLERFAEVLLVSGGRVVDRAPTYRGLGWCFF